MTDADRGGTFRPTQTASVILMYTDIHAFTIKTFCESFGIGRSLAYEEIAAGRLRAKKVGSRTVILRSDALAWAERLPALVDTTAPKAQRGGADR